MNLGFKIKYLLIGAFPLLTSACGNESIKDILAHSQDQQREKTYLQKESYKQLAGVYELSPSDNSGHQVVLFIEKPRPRKQPDSTQVVPEYAISGKICIDDLSEKNQRKNYAYYFSDGVYDSVQKDFVANIYFDDTPVITFSCDFNTVEEPVCSWSPNTAAKHFDFRLRRVATGFQTLAELEKKQIKTQIQCLDSNQ